MKSSVDIGNPIYSKKQTEPTFEHDTFQDLIFDEDGKGHPATITYEGAYYDGSFRVYKCEVSTSLRHVCKDDIHDLLHFREGKSITFECNLNLI